MSDSRKDKAFNVLAQRSVWEQRQRIFYQMRHDGLRRVNKPFPTAADGHFPMIDMQIGQQKPFWVSQAFGGERLCDFVALREQLGEMNEAAADWFDFQLRYRSNLRYEFEQMADYMLLRGRGVLHAVTDPFKDYQIKVQAIDPQFILMDQIYDDFEDADWWVWVQHMSVPQYKRNRNYSQASDVIEAIRGKRDYNFNAILLDKQLREGITHSSNADEIILWHYHERVDDGIIVHTVSPQSDKEIRKAFKIPYEIDGEVSCPFYSFTMEIKDKGWYAPRGLAELIAAFETYATKVWNEKADAMTFWNRPIFTSDNPLDNSANFRFKPGEFVPGNVRAVQMPQPAMSFDEEINFVRGVAEQLARAPDFGTMAPGDEAGKPRTATENNRIAGLQAVGVDHNGDVFRSIRLLKFYRHLWCLMLHATECQKMAGKPPTLAYFVADNLKTMPEQALHDQYLVRPAGGSANKQQRQQRAAMRFTMLKGLPNVDQDKLVSDMLAADDARLVNKLLIPQNVKEADESQDEAVEIGTMMLGFPAQVKPQEDHATRFMVCYGFLHKQGVTGQAPPPGAVQLIQQHMAQHFALLKQQNPAAARQVLAEVQQNEAQNVAQLPQQQPQQALAQ